MSKIRAAALGAVLSVGLAISAGAQGAARPDNSDRGIRGERRGQVERPRRDGMRGERGRFDRGPRRDRVMESLNLTAAQKTRIGSIHDKYRNQFRSLQDQRIAQMRASQDARRRGDTTAVARQRFQQQRQQLQQRFSALRTQQQSEIRGVLTTEQRSRWDAAQARNKRVEGERGRKHRGGRRIKA